MTEPTTTTRHYAKETTHEHTCKACGHVYDCNCRYPMMPPSRCAWCPDTSAAETYQDHGRAVYRGDFVVFGGER